MPSGTIVECSRALVGAWDPWDPGTVVLEIPKGFLWGQQEDRSLLPRPCFSIIFLTSSWDPNFPDFGANLGPTWAQLGAKIDQKSLQEGSKSQPKLHLGFDALLDRILIDVGCDFGAK